MISRHRKVGDENIGGSNQHKRTLTIYRFKKLIVFRSQLAGSH